MKKRIVSMLVAIAMVGAVGVSGSAYNISGTSKDAIIASGKSYIPQYDGIFMYAVDEEEGSAFINGIKGYDEETISVPNELGGYPITALYKGYDPYDSSQSYEVFAGMSNLREVYLPDTITYIDEGGFRDCSNLTSVTLPRDLVYILDNTFSGCSSLEEIFIPSSISIIADSAFDNCPNLKKIKTDDNSTGILRFVNNHKDRGIIVEVNGVPINEESDISTDVVDDNNGDNGNNGNGDNGNNGNNGNSDNTNTPQYMGIYTYLVQNGNVIIVDINTTNVRDVVIPDQINNSPVVSLNRGIGEKPMHLFENSGVTSVVIPNSVTYIAEGAFENCSQLKSVTVSNNLDKIFERTFKGCSSLSSINLPDSLTYLDNSSFIGCADGFVIYHSGKNQAINGYLFRHPEQDANKKASSDTDSQNSSSDISTDTNVSDTDTGTGTDNDSVDTSTENTNSSVQSDTGREKDTESDITINSDLLNTDSSSHSASCSDSSDNDSSSSAVDTGSDTNISGSDSVDEKVSDTDISSVDSTTGTNNDILSETDICSVVDKSDTSTGVDTSSDVNIGDSDVSDTAESVDTPDKGSDTNSSDTDFLKENVYDGKHLYGDVNRDGKISNLDSLKILRHVINLSIFDVDTKLIADVDLDGKVSNVDALKVLRYSIKLNTGASLTGEIMVMM